METMVSSSSHTADLAAYGGERIAKVRIALLVAVIAALGFLAQPAHGVPEALLRVLLAAFLVVQFRVWDDLADRPFDRVHHPRRVLALRNGTDAPFLFAMAVLAAGIAAIVSGLGLAERIAVYAALVAATAALYAARRGSGGESRGLSPVLLLKYPAFVMLPLAAPFGARALACAAGAFAAVALYDRATTPRPAAGAKRATLAAPTADMFENAACYSCGATQSTHFVTAEEDLTGKPGRFTFVKCGRCGLKYQNPRLKVEHIRAYYDDEYIAHRKKTNWGFLTPLYEWTMDKHDRDKAAIVERFVDLGPGSEVLDVGCGAGTFLAKMRDRHGSCVSAVDFKDLSGTPWMKEVDFRCGLFYEQGFGAKRFDLITMWHFLEHDYDPPRTLATARDLLAPEGRLVIEVPRLDSVTWRLYQERWPGLQAPQHTVLFDRHALQAMVRAAGLEIVEYLPYGAFPPYFYVFAGAAFKILEGRGLDLQRAIAPYFLGQLLLAPVLLFQNRLNLAMQTVVCRKPAAGAA
jgi:SAM-dependent methyltransferase